MVAKEIGHVADHQARQATAHTGDVQQILLRQPAPLFHVFLLHLGHDGPAAAKGIAANLEKLPEQAPDPASLAERCFFRQFYDSLLNGFFYT